MDKLLKFIIDSLHGEFVRAGIVTVIFSAILYSIREYFDSIWFYIKQNIKSTVTFRSDSGQYDLFTQYLFTFLPKKHYDSNSKIGIGTYYRIINGKFSVIEIYLDKMMDRYIHSITITSFFCKSLPIFINKKIQELAANKIRISINSHYVESKILPTKNKVLLPTKAGKELYYTIKNILASDISRVGILLYGDPGSGKSRAIVEIAQRFSLNIKFICINAQTNIENIQEAVSNKDYQIDMFDNDTMNRSRNFVIGPKTDSRYTKQVIPQRKIILLEDIDRLSIFQKVSKEEKESKFNLTKTDLLNTFDGIFAPENSIIIATANDYDAIEPALIRAGRFDIHLKFQNPTNQEINKLYKYMMKEESKEFVKNNSGKSLADIFNNIKLKKLGVLKN